SWVRCDNCGREVHLRHSVGARAFVADNDDLARSDLFGSVASDQGIQGLILGVKHAGRAGVNMHFLGNGKGLDNRAAGSDVAAKNRDAPLGGEWVRTGPNDFVAVDFIVAEVTYPFSEEPALFNFLKVLPHSIAGDSEAIEMKNVS